jgi:hypothetical protein
MWASGPNLCHNRSRRHSGIFAAFLKKKNEEEKKRKRVRLKR